MDFRDEFRRFQERDLRHFLVNTGTMIGGFLFYLKFGFYGWPHLIAVVLLWYATLPLDDWIEKERPFPYHAGIITAVVAFFYPLITVSVLFGNLMTNLRSLLKKDTFLLERLEGVGNVFVYVAPFVLMRPPPPGVYLATTLFVLFADSFHKIGHKETKHVKAMWITGLLSLIFVTARFATSDLLFFTLLALLVISLIPFATLKEKKKSWLYTQVWFGFAGIMAYSYYLFIVLP